MKVAKWFDVSEKISNPKVSAFVFKCSKAVVNAAYPFLAKPQYGLDPRSDIIVSMTSFPGRSSSVWQTVCTLLNQTVKPRKIILWLAEDQFPGGESDLPKKLLSLKQYGLSICFCDNLYPHKKYYYTMLENPDARVITVDDDVFYPEYLIEELDKTSRKFPNAVCCTWAHKMTLDSNGKIRPYGEWDFGVGKMEIPRLDVMPVGCGGVLYPPHSLDSNVFNKQEIKELCLRADDLWLKAMALLKGTPAIRISRVYQRTFFTQISSQRYSLHKENVGMDRNSETMQKIIQAYPEVEIRLSGNEHEK